MAPTVPAAKEAGTVTFAGTLVSLAVVANMTLRKKSWVLATLGLISIRHEPGS